MNKYPPAQGQAITTGQSEKVNDIRPITDNEESLMVSIESMEAAVETLICRLIPVLSEPMVNKSASEQPAAPKNAGTSALAQNLITITERIDNIHRNIADLESRLEI